MTEKHPTRPHVEHQGIQSFYSNRTESLVGVLLSRLPDAEHRRRNPFERTPIIVPNFGMKRYLELHIAEHFGICSHIDIDFASRFLSRCYQLVLPNEPQQHQLSRRQLTFAILALWQSPQALAGQSSVLTALLQNHHTAKQRYHLAWQMAGLFLQYLNERPELISAWQRGVKHSQNPHENWQMTLFTQLQLQAFSASDRQRRFQAALPHVDKVLPTVHLFGFHSMPPVQLADFMVLAEYSTVSAYIFNPSVSYWQDIVPESIKAEKQLTAASEAVLMTTGNPLLSAWGQSGKYLIETLNSSPVPTINIDETFTTVCDSVLTWVQTQVRDAAEPSPKAIQQLQHWVDKETNQEISPSLSLQVASSPRREVEILYEYLCQLFEDEGVNPSDILVMVPHLRDYAAHIQAVFGAQPDLNLPFSLANQTTAEADQETQAFLALLQLINNDFCAQDLFDVLSQDIIRQHFHLTAGDVESLHYWLSQSRTAKHFHDNSQGRAGSLEKLLDALLLAAVGGSDCQVNTPRFRRTALAGYENEQRDSLLGFCRFLQTLSGFSRLKTQNQHLSAWQDSLLTLANACLGPNNSVNQHLQNWYEALNSTALIDHLPADKTFDYESVITDITTLLTTEELHGPFLSGGIAFCAMVPMRSIPAQRICLLGLNQDFPHVVAKDPLDLRQARPLWSDRNINKEYRYFFLETLMAARKHLYLSYVGKDDKSGKALAPSVLVDDLLGFIARHCPDYIACIRHDYPLQGFLDTATPTFQRLYLVPKQHDPNTDTLNYPTLPVRYRAKQLADYLSEPFSFYLRHHLSATPISTPENTLSAHDSIALEDGLDRWFFHHAALSQCLFAGDEIQTLIDQNRYPPAAISEVLWEQANDSISPINHALGDFAKDTHQRFSRWLKHSHNGSNFSLLWQTQRYGVQGQWDYHLSALDAKKLLRFWINHVLMNNVGELPNYHSHVFSSTKGIVTHSTLTPFANVGEAQAALSQLLALLELFFHHPYALSCQPASKKSAEILYYKDEDYSLYPTLMKAAKNSEDSDLNAIFKTIDSAVQQHLIQQEV